MTFNDVKLSATFVVGAALEQMVKEMEAIIDLWPETIERERFLRANSSVTHVDVYANVAKHAIKVVTMIKKLTGGCFNAAPGESVVRDNEPSITQNLVENYGINETKLPHTSLVDWTGYAQGANYMLPFLFYMNEPSGIRSYRVPVVGRMNWLALPNLAPVKYSTVWRKPFGFFFLEQLVSSLSTYNLELIHPLFGWSASGTYTATQMWNGKAPKNAIAKIYPSDRLMGDLFASFVASAHDLRKVVDAYNVMQNIAKNTIAVLHQSRSSGITDDAAFYRMRNYVREVIPNFSEFAVNIAGYFYGGSYYTTAHFASDLHGPTNQLRYIFAGDSLLTEMGIADLPVV